MRKILCSVAALICATLACWGAAHASSAVSSSTPRAKSGVAGPFTAKFIRDANNITVMEFSGNYDKDVAGAANLEPRAAVSKEFLRTHADAYDMLVVFTGFPIQTGDAVAFHHKVKNNVRGIGVEQFDNSALYGSASKLMGFIDMADLYPHFENKKAPPIRCAAGRWGFSLAAGVAGPVSSLQFPGQVEALDGEPLNGADVLHVASNQRQALLQGGSRDQGVSHPHPIRELGISVQRDR
jgi:hypothetical protein